MNSETKVHWAKQVERWAASRLTLHEYARLAGVGASSLKNWKWKLGVEARRAAGEPSFVEVAGSAVAAASDNFEVVLLDGVVVRVPATFDAPSLMKLLEVVGGER
jgi:hypothetical protein